MPVTSLRWPVRVAGLTAGLLLAVLGFALPWHGPAAAQSASLDPAPGSILAPVARQVGWLDFDAPRPRIVGRVTPPAYVADVGAVLDRNAVVEIDSPFGGNATMGGDVFVLDLTSGTLSLMVPRADSNESLGSPTWSAQVGFLFDRADLRTSPAVLGQAHYASRIERANTDGTGRNVLVDNARQPSLSPDSTTLAYVRTAGPTGTALLVRPIEGGGDREIVPEGRFADLAYPRWSPEGDRIAFMAPIDYGSAPIGFDEGFSFTPRVAYAHGIPWDLWVVNVDGSGLWRLATLGADDGSAAWSPDGTQIFVFGGAGSYLVGVSSGQTASFQYIVGYGSTIWIGSPPA